VISFTFGQQESRDSPKEKTPSRIPSVVNVSSTNQRTVPLYSYSGALLKWTSEQHIQRLERTLVACGANKKGSINRAVMLRRADKPLPSKLSDYVGTSYSHRQQLRDGHKCWRLRSLTGTRSETNLAPEELRPIFVQVVTDCMGVA
jgi:hypothetical protein